MPEFQPSKFIQTIFPTTSSTAKSTEPTIKTGVFDVLKQSVSGAINKIGSFLSGLTKGVGFGTSALSTPLTTPAPKTQTIPSSPQDVSRAKTIEIPTVPIESKKSTAPLVSQKIETTTPTSSQKQVQIYVDPNLRYGFSSKEGIFSPPSDVSAVEKYYRGLGYEPVFQTASAPPYLTGTYTGKEIPPPTAYPTTPTTPTYSGVEELIQEIQKYQPPIPSNIPEGVSSYVYKDPLGGSSLVFDYTIKPGDSLEKIASNFGVSIDEIKKLNPDKKSIKGALLEGENIRIPAKYQEPEFNEILQQMLKAGATPEQINQLQSQLYDLWVSKKLPGRIADNVVYGLFQNEINQLYNLLDTYTQIISAESYRDTYQRLLDEYGISKDYQRLFDIQRIMQGTLDDVLREAAEAGGIVTQSQVAAVVKFRQGILKQEADILSDIIDMKEKMIDKIMKYTEMDRDELNKRLDKALRIQEKIADLQLKAAKWRYDYQKDLMEKNQKKIESYVKAGLLHSFSPKYLATFTNPYHTNYAGYTATELGVMAEISRRIAVDAESKRKKAAIDLQNAILRGQLLQKELAKPEKPTVWNMLGGRYIYPQETTRGVAQNIVDVFYQYDF